MSKQILNQPLYMILGDYTIEIMTSKKKAEEMVERRKLYDKINGETVSTWQVVKITDEEIRRD